MTSKCDTVEDKWLRSLLMSTSLTAFAPEDTWAYPQHFRMRSKQLFPMDGSLAVSFLGSSSTDWYKDNWLCHRTAFLYKKQSGVDFATESALGAVQCVQQCAIVHVQCVLEGRGGGWYMMWGRTITTSGLRRPLPGSLPCKQWMHKILNFPSLL